MSLKRGSSNDKLKQLGDTKYQLFQCYFFYSAIRIVIFYKKKLLTDFINMLGKYFIRDLNTKSSFNKVTVSRSL